MRKSLSRCCSSVVLALGLVASAHAAAPKLLPSAGPDVTLLWQASASELRMEFLPDALRNTSLTFVAARDNALTLATADDGLLRFTAPTGALSQVVDGRVPLLEALELRIAKRLVTITAPALEPGANAQIAFRLRDGEGRVWFEFRNAHNRMDEQSGDLKFFNMGVVVGPQLAAELGDARLAGMLLAQGSLDTRITRKPDRTLQPSSCSIPDWPFPGLPGDVSLTALGGYQVMRTLLADGPGGNDGEVVVAPSAELKNVGTRDMPWYGKFTGTFPPYGNDQHPFLVWSLYRMNADGSLVQYARSGIKHAFLTINANCTDQTCSPSNVLGLGCEDVYDATTNDVPVNVPCPGVDSCTLGPRSELVPGRGIWGRCGSIYDQNCDGDPQDTQPYGLFDHRLVAYESDFDPGANPGSTQWMEGWYIVRDDGNIFNSMGSTTVNPVWILNSSTFTWNFNTNVGPYSTGPVIDRWINAAPTPLASLSTPISAPEGQARLAVRVRALPGNRYRYDYALMNFDFTREVLSGSNPNLRVVRALGFDRFRLNGGAAEASTFGFRDGDRTVGNDWAVSTVGGAVEWKAPSGQHLPWGTLYSFSFESNSPPVAGTAVLGIAEPGDPTQLQLNTLLPEPPLLADGFENP